MHTAATSPKSRQRAPSERAVATHAKILDAAELVFSANGFDGSTLRDIAALAQVRVSLVHHHGGSKEALFAETVARRAGEIATARIAELAASRAHGPLTVEVVFSAFFRPFLDRAASDPRWRAYARLVAQVSADDRWKAITAAHFDPTAHRFLDELATLAPDSHRDAVATGFVYAVSAMLAHLTSQWRVGALSKGAPGSGDATARLVTFCASGFRAAAGLPQP